MQISDSPRKDWMQRAREKLGGGGYIPPEEILDKKVLCDTWGQGSNRIEWASQGFGQLII